MLAFSALVSGIAYNPSVTVRFPSWKPVVFLLALTCVVVSLFALGRRREWRRVLPAWLQRLSGAGGGGEMRILEMEPGLENRALLDGDDDEDVETGGIRLMGDGDGDMDGDGDGDMDGDEDEPEVEAEVILPEGLLPPEDFLEVCANDAAAAMAKYQGALTWRKRSRLTGLLDRPQEHFTSINELYPHAIHGKSRDNCVVCYEQLGRCDPSEIVRRGISPEMMVWHFVLRNEFVFRCLSVQEEARPEAPATPAVSRLSMASLDPDVTPEILRPTPSPTPAAGVRRKHPKVRRESVWHNSDSSSDSEDDGGGGSGCGSSSGSEESCDEKGSVAPGSPSGAAPPYQPAPAVVAPAPVAGGSRLHAKAWREAPTPADGQPALGVFDGTEDFYGAQPPVHFWGVQPHYPSMQIMTVLDVGGISLSQITAETISFIKQSAEIMDDHYPGRVRRLIVVNAPLLFWSAWSTIAMVLPASVRDKVEILSDCSRLDEWIHPAQRPEEYGGTDVPLRTAPEYRAFEALHDMWSTRQTPAEPVPPLTATTVTSSSSSSRHKSGVGRGSQSAPIASVTQREWRPGSLRVRTRLTDDDDDDDDDMRGDTDPLLGGSDSGNGSPSRRGWVSSLFGRAPATPTAYLGVKSTYRYDKSSSGWIMDVGEGAERAYRTDGARARSNSDYGNGAGSVGIASRSSQELLEEHGLVLAIQAAHLAAQTERREAHESAALASMSHHTSRTGADLGSGGEEGYPGERGDMSGLGAGRGGWASRHGHGDGGKQDGQGKTPGSTFLMVAWVYATCTLLHSSVLMLLPVWMLSPQDHGGLGYSCADCGLVLSCVGIMLLHATHLLRPRLSFVLRASPLRALRVGCGATAIICVLLPLLLAKSAVVDAETAAVLHPQTSHHLYDVDPSSSGLSVPVGWFPSFYPRPASSPLATLLPAFLMSALICSLILSKRASSILLSTVSAPVFSSPRAVLALVGGYIEVLAPSIAGLIFANSYRKELPYPLDSSMFLLLTMCLSALLYVASLLLNIHFRGDFGVITDEAVTPRAGHAEDGASAAGADGKGWNKLLNYFAVPLGDIGLVFSPALTGYNARLQNLKLDVKDM